MQLMNEIVQHSELKPASFQNGSDRTYLQTKIIVDLLKRGVEEQRMLTRDDIIKCYVDFAQRDNKKLMVWRWKDSGDGWRNHHVELSPEEYANEWLVRQRAITWFKQNLGAAIMKGKVLAIPIIDIDQ